MNVRFLLLGVLGLFSAAVATSAWSARDALEKVIMDCENTYLATRQYGQCALLEHDSGFAYLKTLNDNYQYMLLPLTHITGIEDPALLTSKAPSWFYFAWQARSLLIEQIYRDTHQHHLPESSVSLTINPVNQRSQDHMHIHVSCLEPSVEASLEALKTTPKLMNGWEPVKLNTRSGVLSYFAHKMSAETFRTGNLFEMVHTRWGEDIKYATITVVPAKDSGFLALVRVGNQNTPVGAEELQNHTCKIAGKKKLQDTQPRTTDATGEKGSLLTRNDYYNLKKLTFTAPVWDGMKEGQKVSLKWEGPHSYKTTEQTVISNSTPLSFQIPRDEFIDSIGKTVEVSFQVSDGGGLIENSGILSLQVEGQPLKLTAPELSDDNQRLEIHYQGMKSDHKIRIKLYDEIAPKQSETKGSDSGYTIVRVPPEWIQGDKGKEILINYSVKVVDDKKSQFSPMLRIKLP